MPDSRHIAKMASKSTNVAKTGKKNVETFTWTDSEVELLLETVKGYASECHYKGVDWESVKAKYEKITNIFVERYPKLKDGEPPNDEYPKSKSVHQFTKERVSAKLKAIRQKYKKAVDCGKRSGGGRIVMTFYDLCQEIWSGAPSTTSIEGKFVDLYILSCFVYFLHDGKSLIVVLFVSWCIFPASGKQIKYRLLPRPV